jgi:uncharacterized coiled-coil DUF342 family protein
MNTKKNILLAAMALVIAGAGATGASAQTRFDQTHPRRAEVNARLAHENHRVVAERRDGVISRVKAMRMHRKAHMIRVQERRMAARHGGHITRAEKLKLNREENRLSRHIGA